MLLELVMTVCRICSLLLVVFVAANCLAVAKRPELRLPASSLAARESQIWGSALRDSSFAAMLHASATCEASEPPEPLATPNPLISIIDPDTRVSVSFIIGTDGRVHSPLILESAGPAEDRTILDMVRSWRYRPGMCNGAATDSEAKIEFSTH